MQIAVIEMARNILGYEDATSEEFNSESNNKVIHIMPDQKGVVNLGGTLRLGAYPCKLAKDSLVKKIYNNQEEIFERHRHRYEFNNHYREKFIEAGLKISGLSPDQRLVEIVELSDHPWFVGVQFHPEFKSRPNRPHSLFSSFIKAASIKKEGK
jgi:CTP synthase